MYQKGNFQDLSCSLGIALAAEGNLINVYNKLNNYPNFRLKINVKLGTYSDIPKFSAYWNRHFCVVLRF